MLALVEAAVRRQDDLREAETRHTREIMELRAKHYAELRRAEADRIDAIRAVDVGALERAAQVSALQASTLADATTASAETLRNQVLAAAAEARSALSSQLEPLKRDIADLRRSQYEMAGSKAQTGETRLNAGAILGGVSVALVLTFGIVGLVISLALRP